MRAVLEQVTVRIARAKGSTPKQRDQRLARHREQDRMHQEARERAVVQAHKEARDEEELPAV